ncbi:hypothetical protein F4859DRAFT_505716 [Xylaria cf. heliscus]|nr:hypothetical protein F4859DRAFT_505716 [Xylaria cf. heliscus]
MSVELALAIIGAVDLGFKWGEQIRQLCSALKGASKEIVERAVRVETCWIRIAAQLDFSRRTADLMDNDHRALHHRTLNILLDKLQAVHRELDSVRETEAHATPTKHGTTTNTQPPTRADPVLTTRRIKYDFKKKRIDETIDELEAWQSVFDISWLLTLKIADRSVDDAVAKSPVASISASMPPHHAVFLREDGLAKAAITPLPFCAASVAVRKEELLVLDRIECVGPAARTVTKDGVVREVVRHQQEEEGEEAPPTTALTMVFKLAKDLARAVSYVHIFGFVHKNIRPETILLLRNNNAPSSSSRVLATPLSLFLVGFAKFRSEDGITYRAGDREWAKSLYSHPRRQGLTPLDVYVMQHDIYSLGACLLEIGLWESLICYDETGKQVTGRLQQ